MRIFTLSGYQAYLGLGLTLFAGLLATSVQAQVTLVTTRNTLGSTDFVDWGSLGGELTSIASPFSINSNGGLSLTVSEFGPSFTRANEGGVWGGNFALGDHLLYTDVSPSGNGPITIVFASPVSAAGYQIETATGGVFLARLRAFDSSNTDIGTVTETGSSHGGSDNSAIFIGGKRLTPDIKKIVISIDSSQFGDPARFSINRLDIRTTGTAAATPEPGGLALVAGLLLSGSALIRRRRK